jgi:predicted ATPase
MTFGKAGALLEAHFTLGAPLFYLGELILASHHMDQWVALYDPQQHCVHAAAIYGQDAGVACLGFTAWALWLRGYPDAAFTRSYEAMTLAQELAHPYSLAWAMVFVAIIHHIRREGQQARECTEVEMVLASEQGFPFWVTAGMCFQGWALMTEGQVAQAVEQISQGLSIWQTTGAEQIKSYFLSMLAEAYGQDQQTAAGLGVLAEALTLGDTHGERWWHAELYRLEGEFLLQQVSLDEPQAERYFHQALALARHQQAKSLELRAAMSLTRLWQRQGQRAEAYELLAPIYSWFTEGFDTARLMGGLGAPGRARRITRASLYAVLQNAQLRLTGAPPTPPGSTPRVR